MAVKKSVRVKSGLGGRPKGGGVRHSTSHRDITPDIEEITADEIIHHNEEIEDDIRETIRQALVENQGELTKALKTVAQDDPKAFLSSFKDYAEFVLPKLQRTDSKLDPANPVHINYESVEDHVARKAEEESKKDKEPKIIANDFPTKN